MKALPSPESPHKTGRRMSKPLMERRRRERINHSLETLRLLMLENTHNEKLKNPKVEKAEILESVVEFLKSEKEVGRGQEQEKKRVLTSGQTPSCTRLNSYQEGMRSCLLRVSGFIATKSQELEETGGGTNPSSFSLSKPRTLPASSSAAGHAAAVLPQHELTRQTGLQDTRKLLSSTAASAHINDPVWRPWPQ